MPRQARIPNVKFNLKSHDKTKEANSDVLIVLIFRYHGNRMVWSTGEKVKPKYWNVATNRAKNVRNHPEYLEVNERLDKLAQLTIEIFKEFNFGRISIKEFKKELSYRSGYKSRPTQIPTLLEFMKAHTDKYKEEKPDVSTWKSFKTARNHLENFAEEKNLVIDYDTIDWQFKNDFESWLFAPPRSHSANSASKVFQVIKRFMYEGRRLGYHSNSVFEERGFAIKSAKVKNKARLTFEELEQLIALDLSDTPRLERVRDLFILGCYTGLRFSDWYKIRPSHIIEEDGIQMVELMMQKTRDPVVIPLLPELKQVLEKYDYKLPTISSQKFNKYIKEVCELAIADSTFLRIYSKGGRTQSEVIEKWKRVSSHVARRSFASNFFEEGYTAAMLMQITGHSTERQFFQYIDIDRHKVAKDFARQVALNRKLKAEKEKD